MPGCKHKLGLLTLRNCNEPVEVKCPECGKEVCMKHSRLLNGVNVCIECYQKGVGNLKSTHDEAVRRSYSRNRYYSRSSYSPFYYWSGRYYDRDDYETFENDDVGYEEGNYENDDLDDDYFLDS